MGPWGIRTIDHLGTEHLRFEVVEYEPGHWARRHAHGVFYADLLLGGEQEARWQGAEVRRTPGTLALMPVGEAHSTVSVRPTRAFQIAMEPSWVGWARGAGPIGGPCASVDVGPLVWHVTRMWAEFRRRDDLTPAVLEGRLLRFLDALSADESPVEKGTPAWLRRARDYVREHALTGFAVADVAREAGVAPAHLMRSYLRRYGVTLGDDARHSRVALACRLLNDGESGLGEIAHAAGFVDQSHLNRVFKNHTGLTPGEYRRALCGIERSLPSKT